MAGSPFNLRMLENTAASSGATWSLSGLPHLGNHWEGPLLPSPELHHHHHHHPFRLTLREYQGAVENQEAVDVIKMLTAANDYMAQTTGPLKIFIPLLGLLDYGGYGPSLASFLF